MTYPPNKLFWLSSLATKSEAVVAPESVPGLSHTGYGKFTIMNYDADLVYTVLATIGTATRADAVVTLSSVNAVLTVECRAVEGGDATIGYGERKAYTYHSENQQTCGSNCGVVNGSNCFNGTGSCWCGSCASDGTICCGGCYGQTCNDNWVQIKDGTPAGYVDVHGEWSRTWS